MAFRLPNFNLSVSIWRAASAWPGPADVITLGNLSMGRRVIVGQISVNIITELMLPAHTDVRSSICTATPDFIEVPTGSGRWYVAAFVDDVAKGFANEYRLTLMVQNRGVGRPIWPAPIP